MFAVGCIVFPKMSHCGTPADPPFRRPAACLFTRQRLFPKPCHNQSLLCWCLFILHSVRVECGSSGDGGGSDPRLQSLTRVNATPL
jgi:hypothetical protein